VAKRRRSFSLYCVYSLAEPDTYSLPTTRREGKGLHNPEVLSSTGSWGRKLQLKRMNNIKHSHFRC